MTGSLELYDRWLKFCPEPFAQEGYRDLMLAYSTPVRAYHNLSHIAHCFAELDEVRDEAINLKALEGAIWFHDSVYDPHSSVNEENSSWKAYDFTQKVGFPHETREKITVLICSTKVHGPHADHDVLLLSDIDLSILGQREEDFLDYERKIRIEYDHVPEETFRRERARILRSFLDRDSVYFTEHFQRKYEFQAKRNLKGSIERLTQ